MVGEWLTGCVEGWLDHFILLNPTNGSTIDICTTQLCLSTNLCFYALTPTTTLASTTVDICTGQPADYYFSDLIFNTFLKPAKPAPRPKGIFKRYSILIIVMPKLRINCLPMLWHHQLTKFPYCAFSYFKNCTFKKTCIAETLGNPISRMGLWIAR